MTSTPESQFVGEQLALRLKHIDLVRSAATDRQKSSGDSGDDDPNRRTCTCLTNRMTGRHKSWTLPTRNIQVPAVEVSGEKNKMLPMMNQIAIKASLLMLSISYRRRSTISSCPTRMKMSLSPMLPVNALRPERFNPLDMREDRLSSAD